MSDFRSFTLYVLRHGECQHNVDGWAASHDDSPLTENGRNQARANARVLRDVAGRVDDLDYFASSLHRTCMTIELLRDELGLPMAGYRADRRLMELDLGDFTRTQHSALSRVIPEEFRSEPWKYVSPNGESDVMVYERVGRFLASLTRNSVIVTHSVPVSAIRAHYLGLSPEQAMGYHMGNAGVMRLSMGTEALFGR